MIVLMLFWLPNTYAEESNSKTQGDYTVHYSAFPSTFLKPEIAKRYNIPRSGASGVINISVQHKTNTGSEAVSAKVSGSTVNLLQQKNTLAFNEVKEQKAIYYLATFPYTNEEILHFNISVTASENSSPISIKFTKKFYKD
ncbi:DUF4426 domain-containing protein [Zooshikella harenae]|uniref:DUF4426 domain-containing protein n=1 Tax=Zooshikella harenae TaxID=2827238 RepID=A0ABS5Z643_9GAMM|nr:DUF4426 domain-containing protein [Zooshikella harenae]MBU2709521.1 DUF4426 domain-containing protein [Zooshikella harenae]